MIQRTARSRIAAVFIPICLLLGAGCRGKDSAEKGAAPDPAAQTASCDDLVTKLCTRSGEKSALCASGKSLGSVLPNSACTAALTDFAEMERKIDAERKVCTDLMERLCKDIGPDTESCGIVREQTPQFPREQCEQLNQNYADILAELKQKEAQNQPLSMEARDRIAAKGAPSFGPENAKVTIVEFSDFECPFCTRAADVVHQVRARYGDKVRFVFRQFPLPSHSNAHVAAQAALAAHEQGKFWEFHDLLFANQRALSRESLATYAKQANLNVAAFQRALDSQSFKAAVDGDAKLGESVNVNATPTMFINGKRVPNPTAFEPVSKLIEAALSGA